MATPSLSQPVYCDSCNTGFSDFLSDGTPNYMTLWTNGTHDHTAEDYCDPCFIRLSNLDKSKFYLTTPYKRIGEHNIKSGNIENILGSLMTFDNFNNNLNKSINKNSSISFPQSFSTDSEIYALSLRLAKDIWDLSDDEIIRLKNLLISSNLGGFYNNTPKTFGIRLNKIKENDVIELFVVDAITFCPTRGEGDCSFPISIYRNGTIESPLFGTYTPPDSLKPDNIIDEIPIIESSIEPDSLIE